MDTKSIIIDPIDAHLHKDWFEVERNDIGTVIMCPEGCRRLLQKNGQVAYYNKEKDMWEKYTW